MEINRVSLIRRRRLHIWPFINSGIHIGDAALLIESLNWFRSLLRRLVRSKRLASRVELDVASPRGCRHSSTAKLRGYLRSDLSSLIKHIILKGSIADAI